MSLSRRYMLYSRAEKRWITGNKNIATMVAMANDMNSRHGPDFPYWVCDMKTGKIVHVADSADRRTKATP